MSSRFSSSTFVLFAVAFCTISSKQMAVSIISMYAKEYLQASTVQVGIIISMFLGIIISMLFGLLNGALMSFIMFLAKTNLVIFLSALFLMGISHGLVFPIGMVLISNAVKRSQLFLANSLYFFGFDVGGTIGPLLTAFIVIRLGIPPTYAIVAVVPLGVAVLASQLLSKDI